MSVHVSRQIWPIKLPSTDKLVLACLADHADDDGLAYPGMARIAACCGLTERAVRAAMRRLESCQLVTVVELERAARSRRYRVTPDRYLPRNDIPPGTSFPPEPPSGEGGTTFPPGRNHVPVREEPRSPEPSENHQLTTKEPRESAHASRARPRATEAEFDAFWRAYPLRTAKKAARRAWEKIAASDVGAIMAGIERAKNGRQWREGVIPHPATWLNGERWHDEVQAAPPTTTEPRTRDEKNSASAARVRRKYGIDDDERDEDGASDCRADFVTLPRRLG